MKPFSSLDGREEKTKALRAMAFDIVGGHSAYERAPYMIKSLACRAASLCYIIENQEMSVSEFTQANNSYLGICKKISSYTEKLNDK